jgi:hypothetical protein
MSAHFLVTFRGRPVQFVTTHGKLAYEIVAADQASSFLSASDAWFAAHQHQMSPQFCDVINAHTPEEATA